ncbi:MAG: P-loop NTPase [Candidatus Kapaibacteriales bacterium]
MNQTIKIGFLSGKGGVGKSLILANVARIFAEKFSTILIWDNNLFFPIQHFLNGVDPNIRLFDVLTNNFPIEKALVKVNNKIFLIGGSSDNPLEIDTYKKLTFDFKNLINNNDFDIVLLDNPSGFNDDLVDFAKIVDINIVFITEEPTSVLDAYALVKILFHSYGIKNIFIVINNIVDADDGKDVVEKFNLATKKFLGVEFPLIGIIPYVKEVKPNFLNQEIFLENSKKGEFYESLKNMRENILNLISFTKNH